jgi:hypothetical protein
MANKYPRTDCKICSALILGEEKMKGYTMLELRHAGIFGCPCCSVLYRGITYFATNLAIAYEDWESDVNQKTLKDSKLLSESTSITVGFSKDDQRTASLELTCDGEFFHISLSD